MNRHIKTAITVWLAAVLFAAHWQVTIARGTSADDASDELAQGVSELSRLTPQAVPGRVLVKYRSGVSTARKNSLMMAAGAREDREVAGLGVHVMKLPEGADEESYAAELRARPEVEYAEPDYICYPVSAMTPDDPLYSSQWHLPAVSCPTAWGMTEGSDQITIAICDTGVDGTHPDLAPKLVPGWNVVDNNSDTSPAASHGTWTSGTAAATGNNEIGVASPAMNCLIMPVRVTSLSSGAAMLSDLVAGVMWAADHGARVASVSYMVGGSDIMADAGRYIQSKGGVLVVAAGNSGTYNGVPDSPSIIVVSATNQSDGLASFTTTGSYVDISAPGTGILTTAPGNDYQWLSGTSFSAPLVAGAAALMLSVNPNLTPGQVDTLLKVSADDLGQAGWDPGFGWGRLNVGRAIEAVTAMLSGAPDTIPPAVGFAQPQVGGDLNGVIGISKGELVRVNALDDRGVAEVSLFADGVFVGTDTSAPYNFYCDTSSFANGSQHTLTALAKDQAGNTRSVSTTITIRAGYDATPPQVAFVLPAEGQRLRGPETISINATDNQAVQRVDFYADYNLVASWSAAPYSIRWQTNKLAKGSHTLTCIAYDAVGNAASTSITVTK